MNDTPDELNRQAIESFNRGMVDEAVSYWRAALAHAPDNWEIHVYLGSALSQSGDTAGAAEHYERALALQPGLAEGPGTTGRRDRLLQAGHRE